MDNKNKKNGSKNESAELMDQLRIAIREIRARIRILDVELDSLSTITGSVRKAVSDVPLAMSSDIEQVSVDVAECIGIPAALMFTPCRSEPVSFARFCAWAILRQRGYTLAQIGGAFKRDHTAVVHGVQRINDVEFMGRRAQIRVKALKAKGYTLTLE